MKALIVEHCRDAGISIAPRDDDARGTVAVRTS